MRLRALIHSSLAAVGGASFVSFASAGCWLSCPDDKRFEVDEAITAEDVEAILDAPYAYAIGGATPQTADEIECATFCDRASPGDLTGLDSCSFDLSGDVPPPTSTATGTSDPTTSGGDPSGAGTADSGDASTGSTTGSPAEPTTGEIVVGHVTCQGKYAPMCGGRRPLGHVEQRACGRTRLGRAFAGLAHLEAASVAAFEALATQLRGWGAPHALVARCEAAAREEVEHARLLADFAAEHACPVPVPRLMPTEDGLSSAAVHNAVEGCVRETWAALVAHVQACRAEDPRVRRVFARIADDETRHAQLAWDLHEWFIEQLDATARAQVREARACALRRLPRLAREEVEVAPRELGLPDPELAEQLAADLAARLLEAAWPCTRTELVLVAQ